MPARGFFFDSGSSGDRLTREWLQNTPAAWSSTYQAPYHAYKYTNAGGTQYCTLMSIPPVHDFEVNIKLKATNADAMMGVYLRKDRTTITDPGVFWFWCTGGIFGLVFKEAGGGQPVLSSVAYVVDTTKWHNLRMRAVGRRVQGKIWTEDTAEPAWMIDHIIRYREMRNNGTIGLHTTVRDVYHAQIQLTPIRRTGP